MKKLLLLASITCAAALFAHEEHKGGKPITLTGQVVDTGCYISHDSKGPDHEKCAMTCAKKGVPLAIVDSAGKLYLPVAMDHTNQNDKLMPFIEKKVKVTGTAFDKGGLNSIAIKTIEPAE